MKKGIAVILALVLVLSCACLAEETFTFKHGYDYDYRPYSYIDDNGETAGFDIDVCKAVCEYLGWNYEGVPFSWDAKEAELNSGSCDCIWSGFTLNGREDDYVWSIPYSDNTQVVLTLANSGIATLADLAGKLVGVQTATSAMDLLKGDQADLAATFQDLLVYETYTLAITDLLAGAIDAVAIDVTTCNFNVANSDNPDQFLVLEEVLGTEQYAIGFRMGDEELRDQVNAALIALAKDGTLEKIAASKEEYADVLQYLSLTAENASEVEASLAAKAEAAE